jgi:predicted TIM-barrel fold metal-dependent hydrolase
MIDCDIHNTVPSLEVLFPYLPDHWCDYIRHSAFVGPDVNDYPGRSRIAALPESRPEGGGPPGSEPALIQTQVLDRHKLDMGILTCNYWVQCIHHEDLAASMAAAINDWQCDVWLEPEPRFRASLVVPSQNPELAAREIDRLGDHPGFVQVIMPVRTIMPYGKRYFDPIYEAAVRRNLVVGIHYGGAAGHPSTPTGWPVSFYEEYAGMIQLFQSQINSLVAEGVFARFPDLRLTLIEAGFTWLPALMWRLDKEWKGLRHEIPWVKRPPSDYMRDHIRWTTAPADMPDDPTYLNQILEQMQSEDLLLYASDYPHNHGANLPETWIDDLAGTWPQKIRVDNAKAWYRI